MIRTYSSDFFEKDKASQWLELLNTHLQWPVHFDWVDEDEFAAHVECFALGDVHLLAHSISPLALHRTAVPVVPAVAAEQHFALNYIVRGRMILSHHERQNTLTEGDIVLADSHKPSRLTFEQPTHIITLRIPRRLLLAHTAEPERLCNLALTQRHDFTEPIRATLISLLRTGLKGGPAHLYEASLQPFLGMLSFSYVANFGSFLELGSQRAGDRVARIRKYIDENITEPTLSPESVAARFGLSTRYVRKLFAAEGDSVARYIQRRRLESIADRMSNLLFKDRSITDMCYEYGFKSAPHFTRAFKRQFGVTPKEFRRRVSRLRKRA